MKTTRYLFAMSPFIVGVIAPWSVQAQASIYEPFNQPAGSLSGQSSGFGLSGNWTDNQTVNVVSPATLSSYGALDNEGGQADLINGSGVDAWVTTASNLGDDGLLDNGATLWFSLVFQKTSGGGANEHSGFGLGTERVDAAFNGLRMNTGYGVGFYTKNTGVNVCTFNNGGSNNGSSLSVTYSTPALIVGKIEWGATVGDVETITLYHPALTDPRTLGSGVSTTIAGFDQTLLDTVSFAQRNSGGTQTYDEIRFGSTLKSVTPFPPAGVLFKIR